MLILSSRFGDEKRVDIWKCAVFDVLISDAKHLMSEASSGQSSPLPLSNRGRGAPYRQGLVCLIWDDSETLVKKEEILSQDE